MEFSTFQKEQKTTADKRSSKGVTKYFSLHSEGIFVIVVKLFENIVNTFENKNIAKIIYKYL